MRKDTLKDLIEQLNLLTWCSKQNNDLYAKVENALIRRERLHGPANPKVMQSKGVIALHHFASGEYEEALRL